MYLPLYCNNYDDAINILPYTFSVYLMLFVALFLSLIETINAVNT